MRIFLFILALIAGSMAALSLFASMGEGASDIQLIAFGIFLAALAVASGSIAIISRLEEIRDKRG